MRGSEARFSVRVRDIFVFIVPKPALGPTQLPAKCLQVTVPSGLMRLGREADYTLPFQIRVIKAWSCISRHPYALWGRATRGQSSLHWVC
jgi:hypothetical protein